MELITKKQRQKLLKNGWISVHKGENLDHKPVVKLYAPDALITWLLVEVLPSNPDSAYGMCQYDKECPELKIISLKELSEKRGYLGLHIERDDTFEADKPLSQYFKEGCDYFCWAPFEKVSNY